MIGYFSKYFEVTCPLPCLSVLPDNMPQNPRQCSFWSARNLPLADEDQGAIFKSNFVESRMLIIEKNLNSVRITIFSNLTF